jgi:hypothetical protein
MKVINWAAIVIAATTVLHASVSVVLTRRALAGTATTPQRAPAATPPRPVMVAGSPLRGVDAAVLRKTDRSLVLVFAAGCSVCRSSVPFYQRLAKQVAGRSGAQLVVAVTDSVDESRSLLGFQDPTATMVRVNAQDMDIVGTPTLVLCDREGRIVNSWLGKLTDESQDAVLRALIGKPMPTS